MKGSKYIILQHMSWYLNKKTHKEISVEHELQLKLDPNTTTLENV
jgi:hypothetical protein